MTWQKIETAPTDGTWLLLYCPEIKEQGEGWDTPALKTTIGNWDADTFQEPGWKSVEEYTEFWDYGGYTGAGTSTYRHEVEPTHWMPLPDPPK